MDFSVILPAAGRSARFGGPRNKLLEQLVGQSVIAHSVSAFLERPDVVQVVIATFDFHGIRAALEQAETPLDRRVVFCEGGTCRAGSVREALARVNANIAWVAVHDAARPLVSQSLIDRTLAAAVVHGAAVPALPVHLTIKQATGPLPARVERTIPRHTLWAMQTPQIVRREALVDAFDRCPLPLDQVTDDVQLIELAGGEVWLVEGEERNLKITTQADMKLAQGMWREVGPR